MRKIDKIHTITVQGQIKKHKVLLYAISTCPWRKKAKQLLKDNKIEYKYVNADLCKRNNHIYKTHSNKIPHDILTRRLDLRLLTSFIA